MRPLLVGTLLSQVKRVARSRLLGMGFFCFVFWFLFFFLLKINQVAIEFPDHLRTPFERPSGISVIMESDPGSTKNVDNRDYVGTGLNYSKNK